MPTAPVPVVTARIVGWRQEAAVATGIAAVFALYLFTSDYQHLYYDAEDYWQLGHRFYQQGRFSLLNYDESLRGYSYPLLNFACLLVRKAGHWEAVTVVKAVNAALAGLLFGVVGPRLWQARPPARRHCGRTGRGAWLWAALGFGVLARLLQLFAVRLSRPCWPWAPPCG